MKMKYYNLGDLTKNLDNERKPLNSQQREQIRGNGAYPYIGANKIMDYIDDYIFDEKILCLAEDGGTWGFNQKCAVIYNGKTWVNNHTHVLIENGSTNLEYLKYYLNYTSLNKYITGTTRGKLTRRALNLIKIPLPLSLDNQKKIANLLTQVEVLISKRKESIKLFDELLKSTFINIFGDPILNKKWDKVIISDYCLEVVDCINKTAPTVNYETNYKMIRTTNVRNYKVSLEKTKKVNEETYKKWTRRLKPQRNDIVFTREAPVGEAGIILSDDDVFLGQRTMLYRINEEIINVYYLLFELMGSNVQQQVKKMSIGSSVKHLSVPKCKNFKINLPPKPLQDDFAKIVQQVELSKKKYQDSLDELNALFGSLSQKAFKGELDLSKMKLIEKEDESSSIDIKTVSTKSISKENLETYIFDLIELNSFSIADIQHLFERDFTYNDVKEKIFEMLEERKIKHILEEYTSITERFDEKIEHKNKQVKLVVSS